MARAYLTDRDVSDYGEDLINFSQRAAAHALAPQLDRLAQQNADLQRQMAIERRKRLDADVEEAVPNYREIDAMPAWHEWLGQLDPMSGVPRQQLLNDAIASGSTHRVAAFFNCFQAQAGHGEAASTARRPAGRQATDPRAPVYTRAQIKQFFELKRQGKYDAAQAAQIEAEIIRAGAEGRVVGAMEPRGR
jgi:hypothetical protein